MTQPSDNGSRSEATGTVRPLDYQPPLPTDRFIVQDAPDDEAVPLDALFIGGGPAGLAGAIELARLVQNDGTLGEVEIGVLEKAESLGEHSLSGAVVNPRVFRELFPDVEEKDLPLGSIAYEIVGRALARRK